MGLLTASAFSAVLAFAVVNVKAQTLTNYTAPATLNVAQAEHVWRKYASICDQV